MELQEIRPYLSGLVGAVVTVWLANRWSHFVPIAFRSKSREELLAENRWPVRVANGLFFVGIGVAIAMYHFFGFHRADWRPLAFGFGLSSLLPLLALLAGAVMRRSDPKEALVAFAIQRRTPPIVLYAILAAGVVAFAWSVLSFVA